MLWRMAAEPRLDRIGIMLARLDDLPQRHRSVTLHVATPDVDFRTSMRWGRMRSRDDPGSRNSPFPACHAKPLTIGISLAEIAGIANSWQQRPARAGLEIGITLAEIAETPVMVRPPGIATVTGVVRKGRKGRKPIFLLYRYEGIPVESLGGKMARQADSSSAVW
jgi:hypothetical protein